jgi:hypothetical protein
VNVLFWFAGDGELAAASPWSKCNIRRASPQPLEDTAERSDPHVPEMDGMSSTIDPVLGPFKLVRLVQAGAPLILQSEIDD